MGVQHILYHSTWCRSGGLFLLGRDVIGWRQSKSTNETLREEVVVRQFARAEHGILAGADPYLHTTDTENDSERNTEAEEGHCAEWPRFISPWRCGSAATTYVLPRRNLTLKTSRWLPWDTFLTQKIVSMHLGQSFNMMVRPHLNCQKDLLCSHICLQRTFIEDKLIY